MIRNLWMGENIKEAIDSPRFHHQLLPMTLHYEEGFPAVRKPLVYSQVAFFHFSILVRTLWTHWVRKDTLRARTKAVQPSMAFPSNRMATSTPMLTTGKVAM